MRVRGRSIHRRIWTLVLVPLLSLLAVWAFAAMLTVSEAFDARDSAAAADSFSRPAHDVLAALQSERRHAVVHLADPRRADERTALAEARVRTDEELRRLRRTTENAQGGLGDSARSRLDGLWRTLDELERLRGQTDSNTISLPGARDAYSDLTSSCLRFLAVLQPVVDAGDQRHASAVAGLAQAREYISQEDALVAGMLGTGRVTEDEQRSLSDLISRRQVTQQHSVPDLPVDDRQSHTGFWESGTARILTEAETQLLSGRGTPLPEHWEQSASDVLDSTGNLVADAERRLADRLDSATGPVVLRAVLAGVLGLVAVALSLLVALRGGRDLIRDLRALSHDAKDAADVRLPGVTRRLAAGEHVDVEVEAPRLEYGQDELGEIGRAINILQREAVSASVERSYTRRGISEVFVNLARRSQVLLHRQLHLLEALERRDRDGDERVDLVRLDHLSTRMRRHAEGLVILSGAAPTRQWRKPESLAEVLRVAVDEIEDFERVEVRPMPPLLLAGGAVADVVHILAELLENAAVFSPPHTTVQVSGERVPHGCTLEIHDRGLGMTADALRDANQRLAEISEFQLSDTDRIGLFVVARLAERHRIRVALRESPYGGTTAVTLIPGELLTEIEEPRSAPERLVPPPSRPALMDGPMDGPAELAASLRTRTRTRRAGPPADTEEHAAAPGAGGLPRRSPRVLVADHERPPAAEEPPAEEPARPADGVTGAGLPRRVRRAAAEPAPEPPARAGGHPDPESAPDLDAEELRNKLSALQRGWRRGREQTDPGRGDTPPPPSP
ncbi:nitrate- and nitrite sensing domain-containing protein [Streptomyces sp. NBRC 109706]|uniref:sensor histidine kinase n=1 Tax=Streptomyces sp. NBRC 109706 TaxID=1550035 RepID=UPI000782AFDB|nr:nitrate- and nitrite sensing domain-containing protein [Streptomyces sp. NBRC 109706]